MSEPSKPLTEDDLHGFVDERLDPQRRAHVEAWLAQDADAAERVRAYRAQNQHLQALFGAVIDEPVPARLTGALSRKAPRWPWSAAAALAWLAVGGIAGYFVHDYRVPFQAVAVFAERAAVAHAVYTAELRHPVEVGADRGDHLVNWLSNRLGKALRTPDFTRFGYQLVGGRLLPGETGPAAQFMYQDAQNGRLTLYVSVPRAGIEEVTGFQYLDEGNVKVLYWSDRDLSFALVGAASRGQLMDLAHVAYETFGS